MAHKTTQKGRFQCRFLQGDIVNDYPFSVFKRADRPFYSVAFKDESGKYLSPISTKKRTEAEAIQTAFLWLRDGIPQKRAALKVNHLALKDTVRNIETKIEAEIILKELRRQGWVKSYVLADTPQAQDFTAFLIDFWDWEKSAYVKEKRRKNHGLHKYHCVRQGQAVRQYWDPFFKGRFLGDITQTDLDDFVNHMGEKSISAARRNIVIKAGTKALRWAFSKGLIEKDISRGIMLFSGEAEERAILSPTAAAAVFRAEWKDERAKLGNQLAAVSGMRQGEIMALQIQDIGQDCLYVRHGWNHIDKLKGTKNDESRQVELPFPDLIQGLIELAKKNPNGINPESFVFWSDLKAERPMKGDLFLEGLRDALQKTGFSKEAAAGYVFHGWRHFFSSYMAERVTEKILQKQTGHRTIGVLRHYADHELIGDRERIRAAQLETFGGLLPNTTGYIQDRGA
jgi:integrase